MLHSIIINYNRLVNSQFDNSSPYSTGYQIYPRTLDHLVIEDNIPTGLDFLEGIDFVQIDKEAKTTVLRFTVPDYSMVKFSIVSLSGKETSLTTPIGYARGDHEILLKTQGISASIYICMMEIGEFKLSKRIIIRN